ncbi:carboxy terminal-processing peptidase [Pontiella sulfatireligans]|uniref:Tail-specific protease n=1 Tax=Pontiella sulfatireligans TaxID=2750658 RepID=A0A6C2UGB6_9BACT|nr:carboxy terminal-processing peptidase [Pontiella sulfatireligans]VGO18414.1 Tail-specific protease [Pontiella sulfatireligans]
MKLKQIIATTNSTLISCSMLLLVACCSKAREDDRQDAQCIAVAEAPVGTNAVAAQEVRAAAPEIKAVQVQPEATVPKSDLNIKRISRAVAYSLPLYHLNQLSMNEHISTNAFNLFISSLDPARSYFLQSDIDEFSKDSKTLDKQLKKGEITFAIEVYDTLMERIKNRLAFSEKILVEGFDTSVDEDFLWDRKDVAWPKDEAAWDELWRKRLKNEYVSRLVSTQVFADSGTETNSMGLTGTNLIVEIEAVQSNFVAVAETTTSNLVAEAEADSTNQVAGASDEYDEAAEVAALSPEEFILERYKQFLMTMESFDEEMLLQRYLTSFSQVYDPHSDYMSPSSVEDFDINMKLSLVGIGAMLRPDEGSAKIVRVIPGGPADKDGRLKAGDKIVAVAQGDKEPVSIMHWPLYKAVRLIRGEIDTTVVLTVIPASDRTGSRTKKIDLVRAEVKLEEQAAKSEVKEVELEDGTTRTLGIITLPDFYADFKATSKNEKNARRASTDVRRLIDELQLEGIEGLVLDLRNNGGGSLVEAIETAGLFITSGPVVQVKERRGIQVLPDADPEVSYDGPMIVLVNRLSASASEILAAALQDYKRAVIVGDKQTHGKGTVQTLMPLGDKRGSLKLTTAGFYRINGGSTQLKGVSPDIVIPSYLDVMDLGEDSLEHALPWDTIRPAMYRTQSGLSELLPVLAEQSSERIEANEEFQAYLAKRDRLKERYDTKSVSLSLSNRLAEAEAEKEIDDIQSGAFLEDEDGEKKSKDIILNETLYILSDMIELKQVGRTEMLAPNLSASEG